MAKALLYLVIAHLIFIQMYLFQSVNLNRDILIEWLGDKINSDEIIMVNNLSYMPARIS